MFVVKYFHIQINGQDMDLSLKLHLKYISNDSLCIAIKCFANISFMTLFCTLFKINHIWCSER